MIFPIGQQTVGIATQVPVLDGDGNPVLTELMEEQMQSEPSVIPKTGCVFEVQSPATTFVKQAENVTDTTRTTKKVAWVFLPPDDDTTALVTGQQIQYPCPGGQLWDMRGDATVEVNLAGTPDHVFCLVEFQEG
jgi:hypothetical protein